MKTMKNLIFVSVLGTLMIFASCKKETNDVVVTPVTTVRPAADTIWYGHWFASNSQTPDTFSYRITKDSIWYSKAYPNPKKGMPWHIYNTTKQFIFGIQPLYEYSIVQYPSNNLMDLKIGIYVYIFQRQ